MSYGLTAASVHLGGRTVLDDVTLRAEPGSVVAVVGGDGAGKTTLLRALVGEVALAKGAVDAPAPERIGYLPASAGSWSALTVQQNIDFVAGVYDVPAGELEARRSALLERAALSSASSRPASQLSGGMRRKLGFSMAAVHAPELLVLDEPSTGVDPVSRIDLWRLVTQAAAAGAAVVMSTTYLDEAERAASLVILDRGRVLAQGPVDDVLRGFDGVVVRTPVATRPEWSWRRGRDLHELWDAGAAPADADVVVPDLEDVVVALSLRSRAGVPR
jgi:ABC-2 type transport system ATP-binding protein